MSAAVTPERSEVCAEGCSHGGCNAVRQFAAIPCVLCGEPIGYGAAFFRRTGWQVLGHRACVRADLDGWERIEGEVSTP